MVAVTSKTEREWRAPTLDEGQAALLANRMRHDIIRMLTQSKSGHPGGSLSASDIVAALFSSGQMNYDPASPAWEERDHFLLSKGHAAPVLYALYHQMGWISDEDLMTLRQLGSKLQGHPDSHALQGIDVCAGSLGQGLSVAAGEALGFLMDAQKSASQFAAQSPSQSATEPASQLATQSPAEPTHVWVLLGDGEMQEGSNWEAMMFAAHHKLHNLTAILDLNNLQIDGFVTEVNSLGDIDAKVRAFGFHVIHVNGHAIDEIISALKEARTVSDKPTMIVCDTIKGKGVSFMENRAKWHGTAPDAEQAAQALEELDKAAADLTQRYGIAADAPLFPATPKED